jgi:hypothetical protein
MLEVTLDCQFLISLSVFSNIYFLVWKFRLFLYDVYQNTKQNWDKDKQ